MSDTWRALRGPPCLSALAYYVCSGKSGCWLRVLSRPPLHWRLHPGVG
jgi:hypothetical protein